MVCEIRTIADDDLSPPGDRPESRRSLLWNSAGGNPPPHGAVGLRSFSMTVRNSQTVEAIQQRLEQAQMNVSRPGGSVYYCTDPDGITLQLLSQET